MIMLAVLLLGIVGYTIFSNFNNNPIFTDVHHIVED